MKKALTLLALLTACIWLPVMNIQAQAPLPPPCSGTPPPANQCASTCMYCDLSDFSGTTAGFLTTPPPVFCGTIENPQWVGFVAGGTSVTITATPSNCESGNGVQLALYSDCAGTPIACNGGLQGGGNIPTALTASLEKGHAYYLLIDGWAGDICDFNVHIDPPNATVAQPLLPAPDGLESPDGGCRQVEFEANVGPVENAGAYFWVAPPGWTINGMASPVMIGAPVGHAVAVTPSAFPGQLCVQPANSCYIGPTYCKTITESSTIEVELPPIAVSCGSFPYTLPWGDFAAQAGQYCHTYPNPDGCDTITCVQVNAIPVEVSLPVQFICEGGFAIVCGQMFADEGSYSLTCTTANGCDSIIHFFVQKTSPVAEIINQANLLCATLPVLLQSTASVGTKTWLNANGDVVGTGDEFWATEAGAYTLTVTYASGVSCSANTTITVSEGGAPPSPTASATAINCSQATAILTGTVDSTGFESLWQGPNGFISTEAITTTDTPGIYTFRIIDLATGCFSETNVTVYEDFEEPQLSIAAIQNDAFGLGTGAVTLQVDYSGTYGVEWFNAGILVGTGDSIAGLSEGIYVAVVTGSNGCTATISARVLDWINLNICPPAEFAPAPACSEACFVCDLNGFSGINDFPVVSVGTVCGSIIAQNSDWIGFVAMDTLITVTILATNCQTGNGLQVALFEDCTDLDAVACNPGVVGGTDIPLPLEYDKFKIGQTYFLMIDGWAGDVCDYTIEVYPPNSTTLPAPPSTVSAAIVGQSTTCAFQTSTYQVVNAPYAGVFVWDAPSGWLINGQVPPVQLLGSGGSAVEVRPGGGSGELCVRMLNECGVDQQICQSIGVFPPFPPTILPPVTVCHEDLPYVTPWGQAVYQTGTYQTQYAAVSFPCDSIVRQTVIAKDQLVTILPVQLICPGGSVDICGQTFSDPGTYESVCQSVQGCDSLVRFDVMQLSPQITVLEITNDTLGQGVGEITVSVSYPGTYTVEWFRNGHSFGTGETISGLTAGVYEVVVTSSEGCTASVAVEITDTQVGVNNIGASQHWTVFPNPADHVIYLSFRGNQMPEGQIRLLDASGRPVWEQVIQGQLKVDIPCSQIPSGVYALMILSQNTAERHLIVVQR